MAESITTPCSAPFRAGSDITSTSALALALALALAPPTLSLTLPLTRFRHRELSKAATQVQRHFRERKLRKLMRTLRSGKESAETSRREKLEAAELKSACVMQAAYRGHLVRKALRGLSDGAKQTALDDLRRHTSEL